MEANLNDNPVQQYTSWKDYKRMIIFGIFLLIVWGSIWLLLYLKADEVTKDPCAVCAIKMGTSVSCTSHAGGSIPLTRTYFPNGTFTENREEMISIIKNMTQEQERIDAEKIREFNFSS